MVADPCCNPMRSRKAQNMQISTHSRKRTLLQPTIKIKIVIVHLLSTATLYHIERVWHASVCLSSLVAFIYVGRGSIFDATTAW